MGTQGADCAGGGTPAVVAAFAGRNVRESSGTAHMLLSVSRLMEEAGLRAVGPSDLAGHEDNVGELVLVPLLSAAGYNDTFEVRRKPTLTHPIVGEPRSPDYGIYRYQDQPRELFGMIADSKPPGTDLMRWLEKLAGYCGLAGALYGIITNGTDLIVIKPKNGVVNWDYVNHIPTKAALEQRIQRAPSDLPQPQIIYAARVTEVFSERTIEAVAKRCHEIIRSRKGLTVPDRLYEFSKLLVTRILDERRFAERRQRDLFLTAPALDDLRQRNVDIEGYVNRLFQQVKDEIGIFKAKEKIDLPLDVIETMVRYLDQYPLWSRDIDVLGQVYEKFLVKTMTGQELGQYFTPRPVVNAIVEMMNPSRGESILDPAGGSGGFLIGCLQYMKQKYGVRTSGAPVKALAQKLRGLDMLEEATKLCQINLFLHGDCHDNVSRADSLYAKELPKYAIKALLDPERHGIDCIVTNPPFGAKEGTRLDKGWAKSLCEDWQRVGLDLFECAKRAGKYRDLQPQSPFMELCIKMLKKPRSPGSGGRLGVVIDNGLLSNTAHEEPVVRSIIRRECIIEAVIGLPKGTFKPYGSNVIPDFLILRRKHPKEDQGQVFRAEAANIGLVPGVTTYKEASNADLVKIVAAWREWKGIEGVSSGSA